ncbi:hypothetical protein GCM10009744_62610 [Kribbella alba]|uniref:Uncharacterized protein n=1 Tax=Kribbella alba TaxID=190197 RepID=A0ABN2FWR2_9ACTN
MPPEFGVRMQVASDGHDFVLDLVDATLQVAEQQALRNRHCAILAPAPARAGGRAAAKRDTISPAEPEGLTLSDRSTDWGADRAILR